MSVSIQKFLSKKMMQKIWHRFHKFGTVNRLFSKDRFNQNELQIIWFNFDPNP